MGKRDGDCCLVGGPVAFVCVHRELLHPNQSMAILLVGQASASLLCVFITLVCAQYNSSQPQARSGYEYVDPLIGTINGGGMTKYLE
jgi:hypothetical protein